MEVVLNSPPPAAFSPWRNTGPIDWEDGWTPEPVWTVLEKGKFHAPTGLRTPVRLPVASRCTDSPVGEYKEWGRTGEAEETVDVNVTAMAREKQIGFGLCFTYSRIMGTVTAHAPEMLRPADIS